MQVAAGSCAPVVIVSALLITGCGAPSGRSPVTRPPVAPLVGTVPAGPTCPVVRAEDPCPEQPVAAATVELLRGGRIAQATRTGRTGRFRFAAQPGLYTLRATNVGGYRSTATERIVVPTGTDPIVLRLDTGIR